MGSRRIIEIRRMFDLVSQDPSPRTLPLLNSNDTSQPQLTLCVSFQQATPLWEMGRRMPSDSSKVHETSIQKKYYQWLFESSLIFSFTSSSYQLQIETNLLAVSWRFYNAIYLCYWAFHCPTQKWFFFWRFLSTILTVGVVSVIHVT